MIVVVAMTKIFGAKVIFFLDIYAINVINRKKVCRPTCFPRKKKVYLQKSDNDKTINNYYLTKMATEVGGRPENTGLCTAKGRIDNLNYE